MNLRASYFDSFFSLGLSLAGFLSWAVQQLSWSPSHQPWLAALRKTKDSLKMSAEPPDPVFVVDYLQHHQAGPAESSKRPAAGVGQQLPPCPIEQSFPGRVCLFLQHIGHAHVFAHQFEDPSQLPVELRYLSLRTLWRHEVLQPKPRQQPQQHPVWKSYVRRPIFSAGGITLFNLRALQQAAEGGCGYHALQNALLITQACLKASGGPAQALGQLRRLQDSRAFETTHQRVFDLLMEEATVRSDPQSPQRLPSSPPPAQKGSSSLWSTEAIARGILERDHLDWLLAAPESPLPEVQELRRVWAETVFSQSTTGAAQDSCPSKPGILYPDLGSPRHFQDLPEDGEASVISAWPEITMENVER